ncbi:hypothetical protein IWX76_003650 [Pedobacter sp. CAN_A7]|uniref:hypothetical protein n=1 Tax=Pedobacter sp. CAN_A7 TaxID=2787722 RepID=UPI0018CA95C1
MLLKEHKDLKQAIVDIPPKEKDKLLLRLIAKDKVLTEHLHFKLLENEQDLNARHLALKSEIDGAMELLNMDKRLSSKDTLTVFRKLNGQINHHYKVTKAVNSEVELRIYLLHQIPLVFNENVFSSLYKYQDKLSTYYLRTTLSMMNKYKKLHEDWQFDLSGDVDNLLNRIYTSKLAHAAAELGLPKELTS